MSRGSTGPARSFPLELPPDLDLRAVVRSHGWCQLAPFAWNEEAGRLEGVLRRARKRPLGFAVVQDGRGPVGVTLGDSVGPRVRQRVVAGLQRMLAAEVELAGFHALCRRHSHLRWIPRRRLGRFLRGEDLFEDLAKTLLTTNCTWTQTIAMVGRLVAIAGAAPAFPSPEQVLALGEKRLAREVKVGYRARALEELAAAGARGELEALEKEPDDAAFARGIKSMRGFGDYAVASMMLLRGAGSHPVVDSWALARARERHFEGAEVTPRQVLELYEPFGDHRGLVAWFDLNRESYRGPSPLW